MKLTFVPQWAVTDLESCFPPHSCMGSPRTEKGTILAAFAWTLAHGARAPEDCTKNGRVRDNMGKSRVAFTVCSQLLGSTLAFTHWS